MIVIGPEGVVCMVCALGEQGGQCSLGRVSEGKRVVMRCLFIVRGCVSEADCIGPGKD